MTVHDPRPGYKTSTQRIILPGPPGSTNSIRVHWDGKQDARVGGVYLPDEVEESPAFKQWLAAQHKAMTDLRSEVAGFKAARDADPDNPLARLAFQRKKQELVRIRAQFREADPRRMRRGE